MRREVVLRRKFLRRIYEEWYSFIASAIPEGGGAVLELGSTGGFLKNLQPDLITSDVLHAPDVDLVLNGENIPLRSNSLKAIVMTDVLHHIPNSRAFLSEATRCVRTKGRLVLIEPWVTSFSRFIYKNFHREPFDPDAKAWEFPRGGPLTASNQALPWIIFQRDRVQFYSEFPSWHIDRIEPFLPFRYLLSGGLIFPPLMPSWTFDFWKRIEEWLSPWDSRLALFAKILLTRTEDERPPQPES